MILTALGATSSKNPIIGWRNVVTNGNIAATSSDPNFPVSNLANPATRPQWKSAVATSPQYLTITQGPGGAAIDYLAIAAHNFGTIGAKLSVETCTNTGASPQTWTPVNFGISPNTLAPTDNAPIIFRFASSAYQGVRLKIETPAAAPEAGVVYAGASLIFERSVKIDTDHTPINYGRASKVISGMSEAGHFLGRIVTAETFNTQADFAYFTNAWYRANFKPFLDSANEFPFFFAWSPSDHPEDVGYAWLTEDARSPVDTITDRFGVTLKMQGLAA